MPGFKIGGIGDGPENTIGSLLHEHRWLIGQLGPIFVGANSGIWAKEVTLPTSVIERQEILGGLLVYKFAKSVKWEDVTITFYDTQNLYPELCKWKEGIYTNKSGIKTHKPGDGKDGYKAITIIDLLDGTGKSLKNIKLHNSWPSNIDEGRISYESSEIKLLTITLAYDWATIAKCGDGIDDPDGNGSSVEQSGATTSSSPTSSPTLSAAQDDEGPAGSMPGALRG